MELNKVFIIIVTYNGMQWYNRCFGSLRNSEVTLQTIVIDNASSDNTVEYIESNFPEIYLIKSYKNLGFGQANNMGIRYALENGADYVFLLNQDAWIESDTIKTLVEVHKKNQEYGILSPMHLNAEKTAIEKSLLIFLTYPEHINFDLISDFYIGQKKAIYDVREVNAAAWLLPRKTLEMVGGFDPLFFHYGEDDNYLSRVLFHGFRVGLVPAVTICHDTERRVKSGKKAQRSFDKWLLQRSADLLYPDHHVYSMIKEYRKKMLIKLVSFHPNTFKENYYNWRYLVKNKKGILYSRHKNKQVGRSWL